MPSLFRCGVQARAREACSSPSCRPAPSVPPAEDLCVDAAIGMAVMPQERLDDLKVADGQRGSTSVAAQRWMRFVTFRRTPDRVVRT